MITRCEGNFRLFIDFFWCLEYESKSNENILRTNFEIDYGQNFRISHVEQEVKGWFSILHLLSLFYLCACVCVCVYVSAVLNILSIDIVIGSKK